MKRLLILALAGLLSGPAAAQAVRGDTPVSAPALTNGAVALKAAKGTLRWIECYNANAAVAYIQMFDVVSTGVSVGTTPPVLSFGIAGASHLSMSFAGEGVQFDTAISVAATTTATGGSAPITALVCNFGKH